MIHTKRKENKQLLSNPVYFIQFIWINENLSQAAVMASNGIQLFRHFVEIITFPRYFKKHPEFGIGAMKQNKANTIVQ